MDPTSMHLHNLPMAFAVMAAILVTTVGLLSLALPRRGVWTANGGDQSQYRETQPVERRRSHPLRRPVWNRPALS